MSRILRERTVAAKSPYTKQYG